METEFGEKSWKTCSLQMWNGHQMGRISFLVSVMVKCKYLTTLETFVWVASLFCFWSFVFVFVIKKIIWYWGYWVHANINQKSYRKQKMTQNGNVENNMSHFNQIFPFNKRGMKSLILYFNLYEVLFVFRQRWHCSALLMSQELSR